MLTNQFVLVAEDSADEIFIYERTFAEVDFAKHIIVRDGQEVIEYLCGKGEYSDRRRFPFPDWLLMDIKMPRRDGYETLEWLRNNPECQIMPTVVFSSTQEPSEIKHAYQLGANAFFSKPYKMQDMVKILKAIREFWSCAKIPAVPRDQKCP